MVERKERKSRDSINQISIIHTNDNWFEESKERSKPKEMVVVRLNFERNPKIKERNSPDEKIRREIEWKALPIHFHTFFVCLLVKLNKKKSRKSIEFDFQFNSIQSNSFLSIQFKLNSKSNEKKEKKGRYESKGHSAFDLTFTELWWNSED